MKDAVARRACVLRADGDVAGSARSCRERSWRHAEHPIFRASYGGYGFRCPARPGPDVLSVPIEVTTTGDFTQSDDCGDRLPAFGTCQIMVIFKSTSVGSRSGSLIIVGDAFATVVTLTGTGVAAPTPTMTSTPTPSPTATPTSSPTITPTPVTRLLFPFVSNQSGFDTGLAISNETANPFGTTPESASYTINFYNGTSGNLVTATPTINAGTTYATLLSLLQPGFQGYAIAVCGFNLAQAIESLSVANSPFAVLPAKSCC